LDQQEEYEIKVKAFTPSFAVVATTRNIDGFMT